MGDLEEVIRITNQILEMRPDLLGTLRLNSSALAHMGRIEEAQEVLARVLELQADTSLAALEQARPRATEEGMRSFLEGLKSAGLD